jgi:hypothetical protein
MIIELRMNGKKTMITGDVEVTQMIRSLLLDVVKEDKFFDEFGWIVTFTPMSQELQFITIIKQEDSGEALQLEMDL